VYVNGRPSRRFASSSSNRRASDPSGRQTNTAGTLYRLMKGHSLEGAAFPK
jgi:hypothetical protein